MIGKSRIACAAGVLIGLSLPAVEASAGEMVYRGTGTYVVAQTLMPLGNGGATVQTNSEVILNVGPSESAFLFGNCAGLAYISPAGHLSSTAYCNLMEDLANGLDVKVLRAGTSMSGEVIGGWGKWTGATGSVTFRPKADAERGGSFAFAMRVVTP